MSDLPKISESTFQSQVLAASQPVVVDFSATWCGPCKMLAPIVQQLAQEWTGKVKFYQVDVDENPSLAMQYGVMSVPTLILFVKGQPVERMMGYSPKDRIKNKLLRQFIV